MPEAKKNCESIYHEDIAKLNDKSRYAVVFIVSAAIAIFMVSADLFYGNRSLCMGLFLSIY